MLTVDLRDGPEKLRKANTVALFGNGGNMAVAQHMASDIFRHTGKFCYAPDAINTSALADVNDWKVPWMQYAQHADLVIGISCRISAGVSDALLSVKDKSDTILFAPEQHPELYTIIIPAKTYHEFECNVLWQIYMMMESIGVDLPLLPHLQ